MFISLIETNHQIWTLIEKYELKNNGYRSDMILITSCQIVDFLVFIIIINYFLLVLFPFKQLVLSNFNLQGN